MMSRRLILLAACAGMAAEVQADRIVEQPESAYEVLLDDVVLPFGGTGAVVFRPCERCESVSLSVTAATAYVVDGRMLPFADFAAAADALRQSGEGAKAAVYVFYDVESKRVNRLVLDAF